jgi:SAM-dependent methyltransferase
MNRSENLNQYQDSYNKELKFSDENHWFSEHYAKKICNAIRDNNAKSVLSLGIGHKVVNEIITNEFNHGLESYSILEGSVNIINEFAKAYTGYEEKLELVHTYFEEYETTKQFDVIEMGFVLEHVDDPFFILKKYKKYLKDKGVIFIAVPNARSLHRLIGFEAGLTDDIYKLSEYDINLGHKRYFDLDMLSKMVIDSGYKIIKSSGLLLKPITTSQIAQLNWQSNIINALLKIGDDYPEISNGILIEATA